MSVIHYCRILKALSDPTRLRIVWLLNNVDSKICVSEIITVLNVPQYNVSRHLQILKSAGLLEEQKQGRRVYYRLTQPSNDFVSYLYQSLTGIPQDVFANESALCRDLLKKRKDYL